jgi:large subunit ribosomal protein L10
VATKAAAPKREPHKIKTLMRTEIEKKFKSVDGGVVVTFNGLNSEQTYDLRKKLQEKGVKFHIIKNSVAVRAFQTLGYEESKLSKVIAGPVAIVYAPDAKTGMIGAAKAIWDFRTNPANKGLDKVINIKGGFFKGDVLSEAEVKAMKDLPSREQLLAMVAGAFQAPIQGLANCFYQSISNFAGVIAAVEDKKKKESK